MYSTRIDPFRFFQNMINFTGVRLSKFHTELELPVDTTDLEDLKDAE